MENGESISSNERHAVCKDDSCSRQFRNGSNPWMGRYVYGLIFLFINLLAWAARDYGGGALMEVKRLKECAGSRNCLGPKAVLRVSLGCFTFFITMFFTTVGTSKLGEPRDSWHSGWWSAKMVMWISFTTISFLLPSGIIKLYGEIALFGAGVFLLIQLISIISFIMWLNDHFRPERCQIYLMLLATTAYVVCLGGIILMYIWYAPEPSCVLNIFFITSTLVFLQLMTSVSLHPKVNAGILTPGLMGLYVAYLCWFAIRRHESRFMRQCLNKAILTPVNRIFDGFIYDICEPGKCIRNAGPTDETDWFTIISFVVAVLVIVIATFSAGMDAKYFQFRKDRIHAQDDVPYGYGFFHFVFATGAMYFAMLLIGWNTHLPIKRLTIDVGWTSTWVRIVNELLAVFVYLWILVAPLVWRCRQTEST